MVKFMYRPVLLLSGSSELTGEEEEEGEESWRRSGGACFEKEAAVRSIAESFMFDWHLGVRGEAEGMQSSLLKSGRSGLADIT